MRLADALWVNEFARTAERSVASFSVLLQQGEFYEAPLLSGTVEFLVV
jgi:hypothetical protein